jgi:hypothetical protein
MNRTDKKPVKVLAETLNLNKHKPSKDVLNYYTYMYGYAEALRIFDLTPLQAEKILFPDAPKGGGLRPLKGGVEYPLQGNRDQLPEDQARHDIIEYRSINS